MTALDEEARRAQGFGEFLLDAQRFAALDAVSYTHLTLPTNREV